MSAELQDALFNRILSKFSKKSVAVETISGLLNTGKDAIYRRLRGDTMLTPEELAILAQEFQISIDQLIFDRSNTVFFEFNPFSLRINNFQDYLVSIIKAFEKALQLPNVHLYYTSSEIPIFQYCFFPELIAFKLYIWGRTIWDLEFLRRRPFEFGLIDIPSIKLTEELLAYYLSIHSTELWSLNIVDNTLNQIEYLISSGDFANMTDALIICDKLIALSQHQQLMAEHGHKFRANSSPDARGQGFELFHNEMVYTNNTLLISSPSMRLVFTTFANPNYLTSTDDNICDYIEGWFQRLIAKSNPIATHAEKSRNWFFNGLRRKVEQVKSRIDHRITHGV